MFQDSPEGKTHSFNDGCGEPAHNIDFTKLNEQFDKFCKSRNWHPISMGVEYDHYKAFLHTAITQAFLDKWIKLAEKVPLKTLF